MPSPKEIEEKYERMINAWRTLAPDKSFGGMTLAQFETACTPSRTRRQSIAQLENQIAEEIVERDHADRDLSGKMQLVVSGVLADPSEGADSALVEGFGYTRKSARKTGLTRKHKEPAKK